MTVGLGALAVQTSGAQEGRQFKDAWFWGVKTGALFYESQSTTSGAAPLVGGEWLITRSQGGLYLSLDQAFFSTDGGFVDRDPDSTSAFVRKVNLENLRRFHAVVMAFPWQTPDVHPYVGAGLAFNEIASATLASNISNPSRFALAQDSIVVKKAVFSPIFMLGIQKRFNPFSAFVQAAVTPIAQQFFLSGQNSSRPTFSFETGIRWNVGSSIEAAERTH
jgi:hypothetical protein